MPSGPANGVGQIDEKPRRFRATRHSPAVGIVGSMPSSA